jgi:orotate phosphoribosyltransferase
MQNPSTDLSDRANKILAQANVVLQNQHFVYISGDHGSGWINKDVLYLVPAHPSELALLLSKMLVNVAADIVCGPATGGLVMSQWLAYHLNLLSVFAEHSDVEASSTAAHTDEKPLRPPFILRRHYDSTVRGKRVIVVDDIINTGHSALQTIEAVRRAGGNVVCAATVCTRGNVEATAFGVPFIALTEIKVPSWPAETCALCASGVPINEEYAHGHEYVEARKHVTCST